MKFVIKYFLPLLFVVLFASSCHAPEMIDGKDYTVQIYPGTQEVNHGRQYTFYAILSPKSACESLNYYHWVYGTRLTEKKAGTLSVSEMRKILPDVTIDDDSYCVFTTVYVELFSLGWQSATTLKYFATNSLPSDTRYLKIINN